MMGFTRHCATRARVEFEFGRRAGGEQFAWSRVARENNTNTMMWARINCRRARGQITAPTQR